MHPIVAQMHPSPEQQPAIDDRGHDVVVTAGAGTGKTRTLVARYLSLLADGLPLRSIVAVTFTRKAAREMRNRIRDEVRRYLDRPDLDEPERRRWQDLYSALDAARIGTIHSLCTEILRAHPAEAGLDPRFEVVEEGRAAILRGRALDGALAWAADDRQGAQLFALLGERDLREAMESLMGQWSEVREMWAPAEFASRWPAWEARLLAPLRAFVDDGAVQAAFGELVAPRDGGAMSRAEAAGDKLAAPLRRLIEHWEAVRAARARDDWQAIADRLPALRKEMPAVGQGRNWAAADPRPVLADLRAAYDGRVKPHLGKGLDLALERRVAELQPALIAAGGQAAATYLQLKDERQALDFDDLETRALDLLRSRPEVLARWQGEVLALLVDEYQDTNHRQGELVGLLNGERCRLFVVGDAKQSIYRFRGADVVVFRDEREWIADHGGRSLSLDTSYRAHRDLVDALNELLRPVLGEVEDPSRPWAEPFAPLRPHRQEAGAGFVAPHVEVHLAIGPKSGGALDRAADALAARLVELVEGGAQVIADGGPRPLDYGDVAILCRASTSFPPYEDALERAGVPFLTVAGRGFYGRPEIRDLLNALRALADPTDDAALAGLLRSPACGVSDVGLYHLCAARPTGRDHGDGAGSLWDIVRRAPLPAGLSAEDRARAARAAEAMGHLSGMVGRTPVADLLKAFLDATAYRAALVEAGQARAARNVSKLLADAHASGIVGVGEFLEYIGGLRDSGAREGEARTIAEGAVQIMSVHAAKGLEFPVVVLGDATHASPGASGLLVDPDLGILLPLKDGYGQLSAVYRLGQGRSDDQEAAEADRLLYVAATRAREKLIVSACAGIKKDSTLGAPGGWLGQLFGAEGTGLAGKGVPYDEGGAGRHSLNLRAGSVPVACTVYEPGYRPAGLPDQGANRSGPHGAANAAILPPPLLVPLPTTAGVEGRPAAAAEEALPRRVWRLVPPNRRPGAPAWVIGQVVHEALAAWRWPDAEPGWAQWAEARARGCGLADAHQLGDAVGRSARLLRRLRAHPLYAEMDGADRRLHEVPYSLLVDGRVESGILDALYLRHGVWTVVEFKTDDIRDAGALERALGEEGHRAQLGRYVRAAGQLLGEEPRCVLCLLNYAGGVQIRRPPLFE